MDIADQSNDKGTLLHYFLAGLVLYPLTFVFKELFHYFSFAPQREMAGRWGAETEVAGCQTWVLTRRTPTGGLGPARIKRKNLPEGTMPLERVSLWLAAVQQLLN